MRNFTHEGVRIVISREDAMKVENPQQAVWLGLL